MSLVNLTIEPLEDGGFVLTTTTRQVIGRCSPGEGWRNEEGDESAAQLVAHAKTRQAFIDREMLVGRVNGVLRMAESGESEDRGQAAEGE